jgi:hypothetical protein
MQPLAQRRSTAAGVQDAPRTAEALRKGRFERVADSPFEPLDTAVAACVKVVPVARITEVVV